MKKLLGIIILGLLWSNIANAECGDEINPTWSHNDFNATFDYKSTSAKTIYITKIDILTSNDGVMKSIKNHRLGYVLSIRPYGAATKKVSIRNLNLNLIDAASWWCSYVRPAGKPSDLSLKKKKKGSWFKWWYILVGLAAFSIIARVIDASKTSTKKVEKKSLKKSANNENFFEDVWTGKKPLGETFWLYFFVINGIISFGAGYLAVSNDNNIFLLAAAASNIWAGVGVWNSSTNYQLEKIKEKQPYGWAYAAKVAIVLNFLTLISQVGLLLSVN